VLQHNSGGTILPPFTGPGLLLHFESPTDPPTLLADCLVRPTSMTLDKRKGKLYVSEHAGRVVILNISSILAKSSESEQTGSIPNEFVLEQNYPNPFNPSTTIKFALPEKASVTLTVYNMLGEKIKDLFIGEKESGYHQISFDAANLPSGVYVYRLNAGDFLSSKKMMLVK
jgi:hypothetical protein